MTDEVPPGESRRGIAGNSLRALRAARGGTRPTTDSAADSAPDESPEVFDDPAELTDDPAVQPDDGDASDDLPPATPDEAYADEVLDAETEAETAETGGAAHDDTDDPTIDDPSELTDDPSGLPDVAVAESADAAPDEAPDGVPSGEADAAYADEVLEVDPATDTDDSPAATAPDSEAGSGADAAYADEVLEVDPATDTDSDTDSIADGHDDTDDLTIDDPAELTDDPAGEPESTDEADEAGAVSRVATPDDEPPTLAAATPRSRRSRGRSKVSIEKAATADSAASSAAEDGSATASRPPAVPNRTRRKPARFVIVLAAATVVALVFAVVSAVVWYRVEHDDARAIANARNAVRDDARLAVAVVNTVDYTKASASFDQWISVSTGTLRSQISDSKASAAKILAQAKTSSSAVVVDAAVTSLDTGKGTAAVILAVYVKKTPAGKPAVTDRLRIRASMKLVGGEWKLADVGQVAGAVFS